MRSQFSSALIETMSETAVKRLALWAGLQIAADLLPSSYGTAALELCAIHAVNPGHSVHLEAARLLVLDESVPSGIRSAVLAQLTDNYRIHADHALTEIEKIMGSQFVDNMLCDLLEAGLAQVAS